MAWQQSRRPRIGILNRFDPQDIRIWSGTLVFMGKALSKHVGDVVYFGPDSTLQGKLLASLTWWLNRLSTRICKITAIGDHNRILSKHLARFFQNQLATANLDILFAPAASIEIAYLETNVPIVYLSDTTWRDILNYYAEFGSFSSLALREGENIEARAIAKSRAAVYPSAWPARSAHEHYGVPWSKILIYPFGANLDEVPSREEALQHNIDRNLRLLWIGVDWNRKGGDTAVECLRELRRSGIDAHLTVCGCVPPFGHSDPHISVVPFLDKRDPTQRKTLSDLFLGSHFLVFPTRAEAYGIVIAEASAHGLPTLAPATGGVGGVLSDGQNGFLLPCGAVAIDYANAIRDVINDRDKYSALVRSSRTAYKERLNWDTWGESMRSLMLNALESR